MRETKIDKNGNLINIITHNGKILESKWYNDVISIDEIQQLQNTFFDKPPIQEVIKCMKRMYDGYNDETPIYHYYFFELACECVVFQCKWSIKEFLQSEDCIRYAMGMMGPNEKVFPKSLGWDKLFKQKFFSVGGDGIARKPSNFPIAVCKELLEYHKEQIYFNRTRKHKEWKDTHPNYYDTINYYDPSCGWAARMLSAMSVNVNYYGTDPNSELMVTLHECRDLYKEVTGHDKVVNLYEQGSEVFIPELEQKIDIIMTSPPYFGLEDYTHGENQSTKNFPTYDEWLDGYWKGTVLNCKKYLREDGYMIINIKGYSKFDLIEDCKQIAISNGFTYKGEFETSSKIKGALHEGEAMMVFQHNEWTI